MMRTHAFSTVRPTRHRTSSDWPSPAAPLLRPGLPLILAMLLVAAGPSASAATPASGDDDVLAGTTFAEAKQSGHARIVILYFDQASVAAADGDASPRGFEPEMMSLFVHQVEQEEGIAVEVDWRPTTSFREILTRVASARGGVFGINQISATAERREILTFSPPYVKAVSVLVTHSDVPSFGTREEMIEGLRGRRAVTIPGTTFDGFIEELRKGPLPDLEIEYVESASSIPAAIRDDPEGTFAYLDYGQYGVAVRNGLPLRRQPLADRSTEPIAIAMPKGSDWAPLTERFLDPETGFTTDVAWELLVRRYLGSELLGGLRP